MKLHYSKLSNSILDVKLDKRNECFNFGEDNAFPSLVEVLIEMSVTAKTCVDRVSKAIYGGSFGDKGKVVVNKEGQTLNEVLRVSAREYAKHNNVFLHVGYGFDGKLNYKSIKVIPVTDSRVGKSDDKGYSGKFIIYNNWDKRKGGKIMSSGFQMIDRFSRDLEIVLKQIERDEGIQNYNGQLIHIKKDTAYVYSLSDLNPVLNEAYLEAQSQTFRSSGAGKGFLNTKILVTPPMGDEDGKEFKKELNGVRGAENASEIVHLETTQPSEDVSKQMFVSDLSSQYNDKLFQYSDSQAEKNICKAWSVPLVLVSQTDNAMFGNSGELIIQAKIQLYESREEDRNQIEETFSYIMANFSNPVVGLEIINPYEELKEDVDETPKDVNAEAQATLRSSVDGVTSLLAIQQSVAAGTTSIASGISMIVNIYGFTEEIAKEILGNPEKEED